MNRHEQMQARYDEIIAEAEAVGRRWAAEPGGMSYPAMAGDLTAQVRMLCSEMASLLAERDALWARIAELRAALDAEGVARAD